MTEKKFMSLAYDLAKRGQYTTKPGVNVGCVIVKKGKIIGQGWYEKYGGRHAEVNAINSVKRRYPKSYEDALSNSSIYVSLEPCSTHGKTPPCVDELKKYSFKEVVIGDKDKSQNGIKELKKAGLDVKELNLNDLKTNQGFLKKVNLKRPYVRAKIAMSKDGKISFKNNKNKWITSKASRKDAHHYRAISDLIVTGTGTLLKDDPSLNVRDRNITKHKSFKQPDKAVVGNSLKDLKDLKFFKDKLKKIVFASRKKNLPNINQLTNTEVKILNESGSKLDLVSLLNKIEKMGYKEILIEAGPKLLTSFIKADLIDEFIVYIAPKILSNTADSFFEGPSSLNPLKSKKYKIIESTKIGIDKKLIYRKKQKWD